MNRTVIVGMAVDTVTDHAALNELAEVTGATIAYLQMGEPSLPDELDRLVADGATEIQLVRLPAIGKAPARSWLRRVAAHWVRQNPGIHVDVVARAVTGTEAPLMSAGWEDVPSHQHHVLVCRGPRCAAKNAGDTSVALADTLRARGLADNRVLVTQTGCLFPCNHAPVVVVHPDDTWYGSVAPDDVPTIVDDHLLGGQVVEALTRPRSPRPPTSP